MRPFLVSFALTGLPSAALAHGDHHGPEGLLHILGNPDHLGLVVLAGAAASLLSRRGLVMLRRNIGERECRRRARNRTV